MTVIYDTMASSDSNVDATAELQGDEESVEDDDSVELTPEEILAMNSTAEEAFSPE